MDLSAFLFGTGIALLVALLGWGNQIKENQSETKRLELLLAKRLGAKYKQVSEVTKKLDTNNVQQEFVNVLSSVKEIINKDKINSSDHIQKLNSLSSIESDFDIIKKRYILKYELTIKLTLLCIGLGIITFFLNDILGVQHIIIEMINYILSIVPLIYIYRILLLLIEIHKIEREFQNKIIAVDVELED